MSISNQLFTKLSDTSKRQDLTSLGATEYLEIDNRRLESFEVTERKVNETKELGGAKIYTISGINKETKISKTITITAYTLHPDLLTTQVTYINLSDRDIAIKAWINQAYTISSQREETPFWAFQGSSSSERADWIKPVTPGYYQKNYMGMNNSDYGGGIPLTDIWNPEIGITIGHAELNPKLISLPTEMKKYDNEVSVSIRQDFSYPQYLAAGDTLKTLETFVSIHSGDYYNGLTKYSKLMQAKGIQMPEPEPFAFEPIWCAWGYERNFTADEVVGTLPKVKELGIKWAVLDDGFQLAEGDWHVNQDKFSKGDSQMRELVDEIHAQGLKAKLWWAPLAADPGSDLLKENPDMRLYLSDWAPQYITWWDAYYLSPSHPQTIQHTQEIVNLFLNQWDFDGLKMDGQHMNAIAPDYNPKAGLEYPEQGSEKLPAFFKLIYEQAHTIKPHAVIENCPCGTCMSYFNMPYMNQSVSSDPTSSWQIRLKGKTYKALIPNTAYYGDHVELSDNGDDFASSFGVGAVLGTKFTWPKDNPDASGSYLLTKEKEVKWKKWFSLYDQKMLSREIYRGDLYDIAYDRPETHLIQKGDTLHYAFYSDSWDGKVELRGLSKGQYIVRDYVNHREIAEISDQTNKLNIQFKDFILLEVYPK
ncbi:alpha-galactosidase [Reichenbachiella agarivorans]|uniref:Alpha-galactosidase n=1 Tax=Reichenbachiella agarivorans TaxID=2979464 RepID=A0ABY6CVG9_9BACT|nr:glycoside hydrolase family 36 protein [Reichenbachiella agarivorans]UXP32250.1 alpha-galactosidase [Reichenbachiella agarivorans]